MKNTKYIIGMCLLFGVLVSAWFILSPTSKQATAEQINIEAASGSGALDGMTFIGELGPIDKPADVEDTFIFKEGKFVSTECEKNCDFPARPYFTRQVGDKVEFISETRCPYKNAKIVWRGTIDNDSIEGVFTWTISRWYWTRQKDFRFKGMLAEQAPSIADNG